MSEAPVDTNPFNLTEMVETEGFLSGYVAVVKVISEDGDMFTEFVSHEMNNYETIGILLAIVDRLRAENASYPGFEDEED